MSRRSTASRPTPHLDAWLARLQQRLETDGARPDLVKTLADGNPALFPRWQTFLWKLTTRRIIPDGENLLAINAWMEGGRPRPLAVREKRPPNKKPGKIRKSTARTET